jgi:hypothetical protein
MEVNWIEADKLCASYVPDGRDDIQSLYDQSVRAIVTLTEHPLTQNY